MAAPEEEGAFQLSRALVGLAATPVSEFGALAVVTAASAVPADTPASGWQTAATTTTEKAAA
jgi:hypothetical protein